MMKVLFQDAHRRLDRFTSQAEEFQSLCESTLTRILFSQLKSAISTTSKYAEEKKRQQMVIKLKKLKLDSDKDVFNEKKVVNLSSRNLSESEVAVLNKGLKFNTKDSDPLKFMAETEFIMAVNDLKPEDKSTIRSYLTSQMKKHNRHSTFSLKSLKSDSSIIILLADKGGSTAILDRSQYDDKMIEILSDSTSYCEVMNDPTTTQIRKMEKYLLTLKKKKVISAEDYKFISPKETTIAEIYGLPKLHKENYPLRPVVSLVDSPTYYLAKWLFKKLKDLASHSSFSINNSQEFLSKLKCTSVAEDELMVSFDVISLYPSIQLDLAKSCVTEFLSIHPHSLSNTVLLELISLCLNIYFSFKNRFFEQKKGTPMGSPISGLLAELVMQKLENIAISKLQPKFWLRYVDDTFVIMKRNDLNDMLLTLNSIFPGIKFTHEVERNGELAFLDILVKRNSDGFTETSVHRKKAYAGTILNFNSNHPVIHKRNCIRTLFQRTITHCNTEENKNNEIKFLFQLFQNNNYPKQFIERTWSQMKEQLKQNNEVQQTTTIEEQEQRKQTYYTLPYINGISETLSRMFQKHDIKIAHKPTTTLKNQLFKPKKLKSDLERRNVIYQIDCSNCQQKYIGQTRKQLSTRVHEHRLAVRRIDQRSQISTHCVEEDHAFDWSSAKSINSCEHRYGREFMEAWYSSDHSINRHIELDNIYVNFRQAMSSRNF